MPFSFPVSLNIRTTELVKWCFIEERSYKPPLPYNEIESTTHAGAFSVNPLGEVIFKFDERVQNDVALHTWTEPEEDWKLLPCSFHRKRKFILELFEKGCHEKTPHLPCRHEQPGSEQCGSRIAFGDCFCHISTLCVQPSLLIPLHTRVTDENDLGNKLLRPDTSKNRKSWFLALFTSGSVALYTGVFHLENNLSKFTWRVLVSLQQFS